MKFRKILTVDRDKSRDMEVLAHCSSGYDDTACTGGAVDSCRINDTANCNGVRSFDICDYDFSACGVMQWDQCRVDYDGCVSVVDECDVDGEAPCDACANEALAL